MSKLSTLLSLFLLSYSLSAQQIPQKVVNSSGTVFQINNVSITFSVGEPITSTLINTSTILTQGFIQPIKTDLPTSLLYLADLDAAFTTFPNPVTEGVTIEFTDKSITPLKYEVYNNDGRLVLSTSHSNSYINLSILSDGIYWLRPIVVGKQFGVKKIVKTR